MEKQKIERIMQIINTNRDLKKQYEENAELTISMVREWLDAEEKGADLDPNFSRKQAMEYEIQRLGHDLEYHKEKVVEHMAECDLITREIDIRKRSLQLIGREAEYPDEVADIKLMEKELVDDRLALYQSNNQNESKQGPRL